MMEDNEKEGVILKNIATSVLAYKDKILILKRSNKVSTYKGRWACVSGTMEKDETAEETARREISEELGLGRQEVELVRKGEVLYAQDKDILWAIHPFLFNIKNINIELDWEHVEYKWIFPEDIKNYATVPKLKETIECVMKKNRS